jgi:acyl carrier protein
MSVGPARKAESGKVVSGDADVSAVRAVVVPRLATALGVGEELVTDDLELATLGLSSLEVLELVYDAEDELDIMIDEDSLADVTTVGALLVALSTDAR